MQRSLMIFAISLMSLGFLISNGAMAGGHGQQFYSTEGSFADVKQDVVNAVTNKGLVVDYVARIGDMLKRTGSDMGSSKQIYAEAEMLQFCSANYSRAAMEADPSNIIFCPYVIVLYTLPDSPGTVHVGYRRPLGGSDLASRQALLEIEGMLDSVVREALDIK
ncbi:hypothetical protein JCM17960_26100 [Magnetospira thiophila]